MKSIAYIAGFICGLLFVGIGFIVTKKIGENKYGKSEKPYYDERQIAIRGKAYRLGFVIYTVLELAMMLISSCEINLPLNSLLIHGIILFTSFLGVIIYSIWKDAYFQNGERKGAFLVLIIFATLINVFAAIMPKLRGGNFSLSNLLITFFFVIVLINLMAKKLVDNKSAKEE